ncbi:hypothetical protein WICPIJ_002196 [Wickerhamomyces pijperi]|uniref:Ribosome biogenesis protein NSA1 n=1 Tax=Wickerhamomyces pijperi TaxID=599730 RepID=A0A9P8QCC8_WICPI|nr:hypothetical protein WICPIJ_002196 [Wickerhamomyces pijperi]
MRILAATDDAGSFKEVICGRGTDTSIPASKQPKEIKQFHSQGLRNRILKMIVHEGILITARANGQLNFHETTDEEYGLISTVQLELKEQKDKVVSLFVTDGLVFVITETGAVTIVDFSTLRDAEPKKMTTQVKGPVSTFIPHPTQFGVFAYGGKENDVKILRLIPEDLQAHLFKKSKKHVKLTPEQFLYQAKNVKNDKLDLRVPVHPSKLQFINLENHTADSWELLSVTRHGHVRTYDTTHGRKPKTTHTLTNRPILNVALTSNPSEIVCSDDHVTTATFDITTGKLMGKFKGAVGAVQGVHTSGDLIATGGLDRYVRVFDIDGRETIAKVFVGSKISEVWLLDTEDLEEDEQEAEVAQDGKKNKKKRELAEEDEDEDEVWNQLEALEKKSTKKAKKE